MYTRVTLIVNNTLLFVCQLSIFWNKGQHLNAVFNDFVALRNKKNKFEIQETVSSLEKSASNLPLNVTIR